MVRIGMEMSVSDCPPCRITPSCRYIVGPFPYADQSAGPFESFNKRCRLWLRRRFIAGAHEIGCRTGTVDAGLLRRRARGNPRGEHCGGYGLPLAHDTGMFKDVLEFPYVSGVAVVKKKIFCLSGECLFERCATVMRTKVAEEMICRGLSSALRESSLPVRLVSSSRTIQAKPLMLRFDTLRIDDP